MTRERPAPPPADPRKRARRSAHHRTAPPTERVLDPSEPPIDGDRRRRMLDPMPENAPFVTDIEAIRSRARDHLEQGALTPNYEGDVDTAIRLLNDAVA